MRLLVLYFELVILLGATATLVGINLPAWHWNNLFVCVPPKFFFLLYLAAIIFHSVLSIVFKAGLFIFLLKLSCSIRLCASGVIVKLNFYPGFIPDSPLRPHPHAHSTVPKAPLCIYVKSPKLGKHLRLLSFISFHEHLSCGDEWRCLHRS